MNLLAVDTSSKAASVALYKDSLLMGECLYNHGKNHSVYIAPMIEKMLEACDLSFNQIDYFACGVGPGSFTGVRIGVAMIKTFGMVEDKPCVGVDSLYALAAAKAAGEEKLVIAIEDARRNRVFACGVKCETTVIETGVFPLEELYWLLCAYNKDDVLFVGGGTRIYKDDILSHGYSLDMNALITGRAIALAAMGHIKEGKTCDCCSLLPKYLLKSQAEQSKK